MKRGGRKNVRFSTENWLFLRNGERYGLGNYTVSKNIPNTRPIEL